MNNYFEDGQFPPQLQEQGLRKGRSIRDGYARGWGLEFGGIRDYVIDDPIYREAVAVSQGRSLQSENCRMNLFLLAKYFLPRLIDGSSGGSIVEFGSFRGGSAIFRASVCRSLGLNVKVYGLDTFEGMPPTDRSVDAHNAGDFAGVDLDELRAFVESVGLSAMLSFVKGTFEETAGALLTEAPPVLLAHIDCDIHTSVAFAWDVVKPHMANGGYVAFDDAHVSSCLGATEVVEDLPIRRDGLNCEQIWPQFVFRVWQQPQAAAARELPDSHGASGLAQDTTFGDVASKTQLEAARREIARLQEQNQQLSDKLAKAREDNAGPGRQPGLLSEPIDELSMRYGTLRQQVSMAKDSRWVKLGRIFGVGPKFDILE